MTWVGWPSAPIARHHTRLKRASLDWAQKEPWFADVDDVTLEKP